MIKHLFKTILFAFFAGFAISLGCILYIFCSAYIENGKYLGSFLFPIGLILICFFSLNLYTGKIGFVLTTKNKKIYIFNLFIILIGNVAGAFLLGYLFRLMVASNNIVTDYLSTLYKTKINQDYFYSFFSSFFCGLFVYTAIVFFKKFTHNVLKVFGVLISISLFVMLSFHHCVANAFYFAACNELNNPATYISLIISVIGNSLGSITLNELISK